MSEMRSSSRLPRNEPNAGPPSCFSAPSTRNGSLFVHGPPQKFPGTPSSGYDTSPSGPSADACSTPSTNSHRNPLLACRWTATWCHWLSTTDVVPQIVRSPVPSPDTPNTTTPPAIETPNLRSWLKRSRSTTMLPLIHAVFAPQVTAAALLSAAAALIQNSIVKSVAPASTGPPGNAFADSSTRILTRSTSLLPVALNASENPDAKATLERSENANAAMAAMPRRSPGTSVLGAPPRIVCPPQRCPSGRDQVARVHGAQPAL